MTHTTSKRAVARGPAVAATSAALGGRVINIGLTPGAYVGTVSVRVRTRLLSAPIQPGSVAVEVALVQGLLDSGAPTEADDAVDARPADWAKLGYPSTGQGCVWHPNVWVEPQDAKAQLVVRVWHRDDLDASSPVAVDVSVTTSQRPVAGADSGCPYEDAWAERAFNSATDPANGANWATETVPQSLQWKVVGIGSTLVSDGTAASRRVRVRFSDGGVVIGQSANELAQTASLTLVHSFNMQGTDGASTDGWFAHTLPDVILVAGNTISQLTANIQATDNWSTPRYRIRERVVPGTAAV